jgi:two-component system CheB/CheR fusion protein
MTKSAGSDCLERPADDTSTMMSKSAASLIATQARLLHQASHDLRQPLQAACLLQELLAQRLQGDDAEPLVARMATALGALSGQLNHLVDGHQIEFGTFEASPSVVPVSRLLQNVMSEVAYEAQAREVRLRATTNRGLVVADPRLIGHILRSLAWHAVVHTASRKVLIGCRQRRDRIDIEVWYGREGSKFPLRPGEEEALKAIFAIGEKCGQSIRRIATPNSVILRISLPAYEAVARVADPRPERQAPAASDGAMRSARIMVVEDNPSVRETVTLSLRSIGHQVISAASGNEALAVVRDEAVPPDVLLVDLNLAGPMTGLEVAAAIRSHLDLPLPTLILTGNMSTAARSAISDAGFAQIAKPVRLSELKQRLDAILGDFGAVSEETSLPGASVESHGEATVYVIDDDGHIRRSLRSVLEAQQYHVEDFESGEAFLQIADFPSRSCLVIDAYLPQMSGLAVLQRLNERGCAMPSIVVTGHADVGMAVRAMQAGASAFIEKPIASLELLRGVRKAILRSQDSHSKVQRREAAKARLAHLTPKHRMVLERLLEGQLNKVIAHELGISQRTVENHRAKIMARTGTRSLPELARLHLEANGR